MKPYILAIAMLGSAAVAPAQIISNDFAQRGAAQNAKEDEAYQRATELLNDKNYGDAAARFADVVEMKGSRAGAAMYWKAYCQYKNGNAEGALSTLADFKKRYPESKYQKDAEALVIEIRPHNGGVIEGAGSSKEDEELKLLALNRLMDNDPERAIPYIEKLLQTSNSSRLKEKAVFVLAQSDSPKAHEIMYKIARGQLYPAMQYKAVEQLGIVNPNQENFQELVKLYQETSDLKLKKTILNAFGVSGERKYLYDLARTEKDPTLQKAAVNGLGISGAREELHKLYKEFTTYEGKAEVLNAFIISGDSEGFNEVALTETDPKLRRKAIEGIGISGGRNAGPTLIKVYQGAQDKETKRAAANALFLAGDAHDLITLAKAERDPEMKRVLVEKISLTGGKEASDYMIEILDK